MHERKQRQAFIIRSFTGCNYMRSDFKIIRLDLNNFKKEVGQENETKA